MDPMTAMALGSAAVGIIGGISTNKANKEISARQMAFQERMSNTEYQRSMKDMQKAGLNPMLAYQRGGASTPSGAGIPAQNVAKDLPAAANTAIMARRAQAEIENLKSQSKLNTERINSEKASQALAATNSALSLERANSERANQALTGANTGLATANTTLTNYRSQTELNNANIAAQTFQNLTTDGAIKSQRLTVAMAEATAAEIERRIDLTGYGETIRWIERSGGSPYQYLTSLINVLPAGALRQLMRQFRTGVRSNPGRISRNPNSRGAPQFDADGIIHGYD